MSVLITNAEDWICLNVCRSLGKKGVDVETASHEKRAMTFSSRYCNNRHIYTDPSKNENKFVDDIIEIVKNNSYDFLIPTNDATLMTLSSNRDKIEKYVNLPLPSNETLEICDDKSKTIKLAKKIGVPHPKTVFLEDNSDIDRVLNELEFPVVIKPFRGQGARGVVFIKSPEMLEKEYSRIIDTYGKAMIQEYIEGYRYNL
ncbi:MAG: ATP-grasp domain-containing protein, partial [Candidatus Aenigmatarchaeota archaeon]